MTMNLFLFGSLTIELRGTNVQNAISSFHQHAIRLNRIRPRHEKYICTIQASDFWELYHICRYHRVKIRVISRDGLPFIARQGKKRTSFVFGTALFFLLIFLASSMVWKVDISGIGEDTVASVRQAARSTGLYPGSLKWNLASEDDMARKILIDNPNLMWVGVHIDGSVATIQTIEKVEGVGGEAVKPQNIVAAKPAVIVKVFASRGKVFVKPGQFVQPGHVLISGDLFEGQTLVPAQGTAIAEVWYVSKVRVPLKVSSVGFTGIYAKREYLEFGAFPVRVWGWREPNFKISTERVSETDWHVGKWFLPIQLKTVTEYQVENDIGQITLQDANKQCLLLASQDVQTQMGKDGAVVQQMVLHHEVSHGTLYETVLTRTQEDIGIATPLEVTEMDSETHTNSTT